jgi:hypothetical protein
VRPDRELRSTMRLLPELRPWVTALVRRWK